MTSNRRVAPAAMVRWMISVVVVVARVVLPSKWHVIHTICINIPINAVVQLDYQKMHPNVSSRGTLERRRREEEIVA